jgi:hypothetical protein
LLLISPSNRSADRRCPGRHLADATLWLFIVSVLAEFEIVKVKGARDISASDAYPAEGMVMYVASIL